MIAGLTNGVIMLLVIPKSRAICETASMSVAESVQAQHPGSLIVEVVLPFDRRRVKSLSSSETSSSLRVFYPENDPDTLPNESPLCVV